MNCSISKHNDAAGIFYMINPVMARKRLGRVETHHAA